MSHMAPEALLHGRISKAGDVYSFGITLWELFTGGQAYQGERRCGWNEARPGGGLPSHGGPLHGRCRGLGAAVFLASRRAFLPPKLEQCRGLTPAWLGLMWSSIASFVYLQQCHHQGRHVAAHSSSSATRELYQLVHMSQHLVMSVSVCGAVL